jgi:tetratricopeptide (TPR) repeat protein
MRCFTFILLMLYTCLTVARADSFADALALEKQGKHVEAAASYEDFLKKKPTSFAALFNLGNCYFATKNYGNAILAYERALSINPRAADVRKNLALARKAAFPNEAIDVSVGRFSLLSRSEWAMTVVLAAWMIGISSLCATFISRARKALLGIAAICLVPIVVASMAMHQRRGESLRAIVTASESNLLLSPFSAAEAVTPCPPGTMVFMEQSQTDFTYVRLASSNTAGWISTKDIERIER